MQMGERALQVIRHDRVAVVTATSLASIGTGVPDGTAFVEVQAEVQAVRWADLDGGGPPVAGSVGQLIAVGTVKEFVAADFPRLSFIAETAGAFINVTFYRVF